MGIVAMGLDLLRVERLEEVVARRGATFLERVFTADERAYCDAHARPGTHYAGRFAVKEAVMKTLGTGWAHGVRWLDIEVVREPGQAPRVRLHGTTARIAAERGIDRLHVTITHDAGIAAAVAIGESG